MKSLPNINRVLLRSVPRTPWLPPSPPLPTTHPTPSYHPTPSTLHPCQTALLFFVLFPAGQSYSKQQRHLPSAFERRWSLQTNFYPVEYKGVFLVSCFLLIKRWMWWVQIEWLFCTLRYKLKLTIEKKNIINCHFNSACLFLGNNRRRK